MTKILDTKTPVMTKEGYGVINGIPYGEGQSEWTSGFDETHYFMPAADKSRLKAATRAALKRTA